MPYAKNRESMVDSIINTTSPGEADVILLAANYDRTSSFGKGANRGPGAIRAVLDSQIELYERFTGTVPAERLKIAFVDLTDLNKLSPEQMVETVAKAFKERYQDGKFIISIGGEHSITNGPLQALRERADSITIVHLDAHFDLRHDDSDYNDVPTGIYAHSAVMRRASEMGFSIVSVGIRAYSQDELSYAQSLERKGMMAFFEWGRSQKDPCALFREYDLEDILCTVETKDVYLSIDVDGFDPAVMPETGTPVPGGFGWDYGVRLLNALFDRKNVVAADIVEVAPESQHSRTAYNAAQLVHNMIAQRFKRQLQKRS